MQAAFESITSWITANFGWWYVLLAFAFVVFCIALGLSKKGDIKLGRPDDEPEFSLMSWFALLFAAGMGIGLVFLGVTEPRSWIRAFFAVATSVLAAALLMAGGLEALQAASISVALPFSFVMVLLAIATWKYLGDNVRRNDKLRREAFIEEIAEAYGLETGETESTTKKSDTWWRGLRK